MTASQGQGPITGINITPLVDVCLVLVIIFMVTAPLLMQPILPVELPKAITQEGKGKDNITITISKEGKWALNETEVQLTDLEQALARKVEASRDRYVIIRADKETRHLLALQALQIAKRAGGKDFAIATEQKKREKK